MCPSDTTPSGDLYHSARLAAGYAFARPPVHPRVLERIARHDTVRRCAIERALDLGCGAGLSTAALAPLAPVRVGLEPAGAMLAHRRALAPGAHFVVGRAERLPFAARSFDLVTAAGALNYTDKALALAEIARVLAHGGVLAIYDFSSGRRSAGAPALDEWFAAFERRYPFPGGYAMDARTLDFHAAGLRLVDYQRFEIGLPLTFEAYVAYVLTEANVESAIASGVPPSLVTEWCRRSLAPIFDAGTLDVIFEGYIALVVVNPDLSPVTA